MAAIEILDLEKSYLVGFSRKRPRLALRPLRLVIQEGEVFGFLGRNGAGKTTTLKLLMGLVFPTAGTARILGMDMDDPRVKSQIGFLPEQPYFYDHLSARELLNYYAQLSGVPAKGRSARVEQMLARVGLSDSAGVQLRKFSKGMLQRLGLAQAIVHDPKLVFLDEPMSGLDPIGRREVRELIQGLKDEGKTVFFSTHILSDAEALCDRVAVIHKGELRGIGVVEALKSATADQVEVIWHGAGALPAVSSLLKESRVTGDMVRAIVSTGSADLLLEKLRQQHAQLISFTPLHGALEDYFLAHTSDREEVKA